MMTDQRDVWFPAKKHGIGWGLPVAWQGWVVLLAVVLLFVVGLLVVLPASGAGVFAVYLAAILAVFIAICWKKGAKIELRRGKDK